MLRLRTFGGLSIERVDAADGGSSPSATAARRRLALLAVLAALRPRGVSRDKLLALFWPESDSDRARHALDQTLYALKRDFGGEALITGREELTINSAALTSDVDDFQSALARGDRSAAIALYAGAFLDGVFISGAPEFERWAEEERARLAREVESALEAMATEASRQGDHAGAVQQWRRLATMEPRKTRVVLSLMTELAATGDRAGAIRHAEIYDTLVREDLGAEPNPAVAALADRIRREPLSPRTVPRPAVLSSEPSRKPASLPPELPSTGTAPHQPAPRPRLTVEWLRRRTTRAYYVAGTAMALVLILSLTIVRLLLAHRSTSARPWIVLADFDNRTREALFDNALDAALAAGIEQSAEVALFPAGRVQQTLTRMGRATTSSHLDESTAREVAQREGIRAVIVPSIDRVDSSYVITARVLDAGSGAALAATSRVAKQRGDVIDALDFVVRELRREIGESADAIARHDLPLPQATTRSIEALRKFADGLAAWHRGDRKTARVLYDEAVALDSNFALAHAQLGVWFYWANDRPNGDRHFDRALRELDRLTDRERLIVRASAESWRGNREAAIELRRALLAIYPADPEAHAQIGYDYMRLHRPHEAIAALNEQIERDSTNPSDYINLATAYRQLGEYEQSIRYYRRAFAIQPSYLTLENLNHEYGTALVLAGKLADARSVYDSMMHGDADQRARGARSLGLLAMMQGRFDEAIGHLREAVLLSQGPNRELPEARNRLFLASMEQQKGWRDSATQELQRAHGLFRRAYLEPRFLLYLGKALARGGQLALATEVHDSLIRRMRIDNPQDRNDERILNAELALTRGHADSAVHGLWLAYAADSSAYVRESLAHALAASGELLPAARYYEALANAPESWYGWEAQAYGIQAPLDGATLYERLGDQDHARVLYQRASTQWTAADSDVILLRQARDGLARLRGLEPARR